MKPVEHIFPGLKLRLGDQVDHNGADAQLTDEGVVLASCPDGQLPMFIFFWLGCSFKILCYKLDDGISDLRRGIKICNFNFS